VFYLFSNSVYFGYSSVFDCLLNTCLSHMVIWNARRSQVAIFSAPLTGFLISDP